MLNFREVREGPMQQQLFSKLQVTKPRSTQYHTSHALIVATEPVQLAVLPKSQLLINATMQAVSNRLVESRDADD